MAYIKNIEQDTVLSLAGQVEAQPGQIVSRHLAQNRAVSVTLFAFAQGEEIHIYIDPADQEKQNLLSMETGCDIRVSQYPFSGGTRAVIASKNILIDNSFETKLKEAGENFQFILGGARS